MGLKTDFASSKMGGKRAAQTGIAKGNPSLSAIFVAGSLQKLLCTSVLLEWDNEFSIAKVNEKHGKFLLHKAFADCRAVGKRAKSIRNTVEGAGKS